MPEEEPTNPWDAVFLPEDELGSMDGGGGQYIEPMPEGGGYEPGGYEPSPSGGYEGPTDWNRIAGLDWKAIFQGQYGISPDEDLASGGSWAEIEAWRQSLLGGLRAKDQWALDLAGIDLGGGGGGGTRPGGSTRRAMGGFAQAPNEMDLYAMKGPERERDFKLRERLAAIQEADQALRSRLGYAQATGYYVPGPGEPAPPPIHGVEMMNQPWGAMPSQFGGGMLGGQGQELGQGSGQGQYQVPPPPYYGE